MCLECVIQNRRLNWSLYKRVQGQFVIRSKLEGHFGLRVGFKWISFACKIIKNQIFGVADFESHPTVGDGFPLVRRQQNLAAVLRVHPPFIWAKQ